MSELQKSFAKTQLSKLPLEPITIFDEREEDEDELSGLPLESPNDSSSSASSTGTIRPSPSKNLFERPRGQKTGRSGLSPLPWNDFFSQELYFDRQIDGAVIHYHAYLSSPSALGPLFVTHHGAGSSGLSFANFAAEMQKLLPQCGLLSLDARGHGSTKIEQTCPQENAAILDLTLDTLSSDLDFVVRSTKSYMKWKKLPDIILIGHSLGGAVVTHVAHKRLLENALLGFAVLDVVEGSAMDALQSMESYLSTRPKSFVSLASGIEWHSRSRTIRNTTSARVSVPPLLHIAPETQQYTWVTDLSATKPFWEDWFQGLSRKFLESRGGKLLLLAGTDRLDKELMIGQMQGKYQLQVFPEAGHFVHEDQPVKTAQILTDFYKRNDRGGLVLPPKVDDLIRQGMLKKALEESPGG